MGFEINNPNVNFNQKIKKEAQTGEGLARDIVLFADNNAAAVSKAEFQAKLNKMEKLSTQDLIKFIRGFDKDESIIELICDEIGDDKKVRKEACKKVLNALVNKAKELGIETSDFEKQFTEELGSQFGFLGKYINTNKLDSIINALTQSIENRQNLTSEDLQTIQNTSAEEGANQSNDVLENRLEKAYAAFGERVGEDGEMTDEHTIQVRVTDEEGNELEKFENITTKYNGQMQRDGIAADIADGVSRIWGSENTAAKVRKDLKVSNAQLQQLKEAKLQGKEAYKAKFKEIFGVEYDYANILAYQKAETTYINASANHELEMGFNRTFKTLLSRAPLREETESVSADPSTNIMITTVTATKEQVYSREFNNLANFIGENGTEILNKALEEKGVTNGTIEEKFEVLKQIAQALSKQLHSATLEAGGGKEFSEVQAMYDNSYKAAYGVENDIMKRVTDYNISQEMGAGVVKAGVTVAASLAAAFSGIGLVGVAAITAGTTVATEVVDRGTSGKALNALREDGVGAYIKTANDDINWEATLKQAVISGGAVLIGGAVAKGVSIVMEGAKPAAQAIAQFGGDIVCDAGMEYLTTGKITVEGMVFTVLLSAAGNIVAMKQLSATADAAKSADEASVKSPTANPKTSTTGNNINAKLKDANNFIEFLQDSHISYDYVNEGNKLIVRISDDTRIMHNDRFDYYVFENNQLTEVHTTAKSNKMGSNIEWNYHSGRSSNLNSGVNPKPIIESIEAHNAAKKLRGLVTPEFNSSSVVKSPYGNFNLITTEDGANEVINRLIKCQTNSLNDVDNGTMTKGATFWDSGRKYWLDSAHSIERGTEWKIHLYADNAVEYANVAELAIPYLKMQNKNDNLSFKTIRDIEHLKMLRNSENYGDAQKGKAFTIYFKNEEDFVRTAKELEELFDNSGLKSSGKVKNEAQIGNSGFVSYRNKLEPRLSSNYKPADVVDPLANVDSQVPKYSLVEDSEVEIIAIDEPEVILAKAVDEPEVEIIAFDEPEVEVIAFEEPEVEVLSVKESVIEGIPANEPEVEIIAFDEPEVILAKAVDEPEVEVIAFEDLNIKSTEYDDVYKRKRTDNNYYNYENDAHMLNMMMLDDLNNYGDF